MDTKTRGLAVAGGLLGAFIATGCAAHASGSTRESVPGCAPSRAPSIERHIAGVRARSPCAGEGRRVGVDQAAAGPVLRVAGNSRDGGTVRPQAADPGVHLTSVIASLPRIAARTGPPRAAGGSASPAIAQNRVLGFMTLTSWFVSVSSGGFMLTTWIAHGGPRQQRSKREGLPPGVIFTHFGLAFSGFLLWISFLASGVVVLGWVAAGLLVPVVGLGISTLTLWTPYPTRGRSSGSDPPPDLNGPRHAGSLLGTPAEDALARRVSDEEFFSALTNDEIARRLTEEVLTSALMDPSVAGRKPKGHLAALVPAVHGLAAITTILFAMLTAATMR